MTGSMWDPEKRCRAEKHQSKGLHRQYSAFDIVFESACWHREDLSRHGYGCGSLVKKEIKRIVLTRPAVEAGEHLDFAGRSLREGNPYSASL